MKTLWHYCGLCVIVAGSVFADRPGGGGVDGMAYPVLQSASGGQGGGTQLSVPCDNLLYEQPYDGSSGASVAQDFSDFTTFSSYQFDDFVVPAGEVWTINTIRIFGRESGDSSYNLDVFAEIWDGLPGSGGVVLASVSGTQIGADLQLEFGDQTLGSGTYWLTAWVQRPFGDGGQWFWFRTTPVLGSEHYFYNPGGGFGYGTDPIPGNEVFGSASDQAFRICGEVCELSPTLSLTAPDACYGVGDSLTVSIELSGLCAYQGVLGGQYFLEYDDSLLQFDSANSTGSLPLEIYDDVPGDGGVGTIDYSNGVNFGDPPSSAGGVVVELHFTVLGDVHNGLSLVSFREHAPPTELADENGDALEVTTSDLSPLENADPPHLALKAEPGCYSAGDELVVSLDLSGLCGAQPVLGGQYFLEYDNSVLQFDSATSTGPFSLEIYEAVPGDGGSGTIDYSNGVPLGDPATTDEGVVARLHFTLLADVDTGTSLVAFRSHAPPTQLSDENGDAVVVTTSDLAPFEVSGPPELSLSALERCYVVGDELVVSLTLGNVCESLLGGQYFLAYDDDVLQFDSASSAGPFPLEIYEAVPGDDGAGTIDYSNGVPLGDPATTGEGVIAQFHFTVRTAALHNGDSAVWFRGHSPPTQLSDENGDPVAAATADLPPQALHGDMDCNGDVDFNDIDGFVEALIGQANYEALYPDCIWLNGDIDCSGCVNFNDIDGFVELLL